MSYLAEPLRSETQHDVLALVLPDSYFPTHALPALNKRLKTQQKVVVRAINEVFDKTNNVETTTNNTLSQVFDIFGDFLANTTLKDNAQKVAPTVLEAITKLQLDIAGNLDEPIMLPKSANEMILEAHKKVDIVEEIFFAANQNTATIVTEDIDIHLIDEDNIKWKKDIDFTITSNSIELLMTLPYDMTFKVYKN